MIMLKDMLNHVSTWSYWFSIISSFLIIGGGCKSGELVPDVEEERHTLYLNPSYLTLENGKDSKTVTVFSSQPWALAIEADWLTASRNTGGNWESVVITATANESLAERETQIEFTTGNRKVQLDVMQKAPVFTTVEKNVLDFMALHKIPAA